MCSASRLNSWPYQHLLEKALKAPRGQNALAYLTGTSVKDGEKKVFRIATKRSFLGRRVEKKSEKKEKKR
jgi:hypothetical protein